jgi:GPI-anchor transamidase subunit U
LQGIGGGALLIATFVSSVGVLLVASAAVTGGSWAFVDATYLFVLRVRDLTPNIGLFWYLMAEIFSEYRTFYTFCLQLHCFVYAVPLAIKVRQRPMVVAWALMAIVATFQAYPTMGEHAVHGVLSALIVTHIGMHRVVVVAIVGLFTGAFAAVAYHAWLVGGAGNANFVYATTLVWALAIIYLLTDTLARIRERDYRFKRNLPIPPVTAHTPSTTPALADKKVQ